MLNVRPIKLKGLSMLLKGFVLISVLHREKRAGITLEAPC